ncbi:MAG: hypothetical protein CM1200mP26_25200 [Acidimicrobiales bacterium]|nr:MAG: hypothetical protein CM1200mP26_25200 [Acidimicrobiales bacterium]
MSTSNGIRLGRAADNDLVISHPSISAHHAELHFDGEQFLLRDLSSSNGTFVNGERVTSATLDTGDIVHLGPVALEFQNGQLQIRVDYDSEPDGEPSESKTKAKPALLLVLLAGIATATLFFVTNSSDDTEPKAATQSTTQALTTTQTPTTQALTTTQTPTTQALTTTQTPTTQAPTTTQTPTTTIPPTTTTQTPTTQAPTTTQTPTTQAPTTTQTPTTTIPPTTTISAAEIASQAILTATYKWGYSEGNQRPPGATHPPGRRLLRAEHPDRAGPGTRRTRPLHSGRTEPSTHDDPGPTTPGPSNNYPGPDKTVALSTVAVVDLYSQPPDLEDKIRRPSPPQWEI